ncbi:MAG: PLP-dependent aminotransferase family protein [Burkholderiales bacterium]
MLIKTAALSLSVQLADRFAERIESRLLAPGVRLPSVRECARTQGVSCATVVAAYDRLTAQGLLEAKANRGFFVRSPPSPPGVAARDPAGRPAFGRHPPVDAAALMRGMLGGPDDRLQPGMGTLPPSWLEVDFLSAALRRQIAPKALQAMSSHYGDPAGDAGLRGALAGRLGTLSIDATPAQLITTVGATQGLDIVSRTLLAAGDCVMVEEPGWAIEFARLASLGMRILPVPRGADGPDFSVMARYCETHAPKLFVSVSVLHNPTGASLAPHAAHRLLQLATQHNFHVMEDDTYSHLAPAHATRLAALDGLNRCIYVSGFAKILAPNWRVGYIAAPAALVPRLLQTKLLSTLTTPALLERALAWCIERGQLRRHADRMRSRLDQARGRSVRLAIGAGCRFAAEPAGLFGWVDTGVDTDVLAQTMLDDGYLLAPGALFHAVQRPSTLMRINFATTQDAAFWRVFRERVDAMRHVVGARADAAAANAARAALARSSP